MAIDAETRGSPGWWLVYLAKKLGDRQERLLRLDAYYRGDPPLPEGAQNQVDAFKAFQRKARSNFAELTVEATRELMAPLAFRTPAVQNQSSASIGDSALWDAWQENDLDVESSEVHTWFLELGDGYTITGLDRETGRPVITPESPFQVVTEHDPVRQRRVRAAAKVFHDVIRGRSYAYLFLPGRRYVASLEEQVPGLGPRDVHFDASSWKWDGEFGGAEGEPVPRNLVPVVRFRNKRGVGEYEPHLDLLDRINHMLLQRMMIATLQAFRQRAVEGDLPTHDDEGKEIDYNYVFSADPGALWRLPDGVKLTDLAQADLTPMLSSVKDDVQHLAAVTRTPLHYFTPDAANGSAEGASLMRAGQVAKAKDRIKRLGPGWEQTMAIAFGLMGDDDRSDAAKIRLRWANPEQFSLAERFSAAAQATGAGVPWQGVMEDVLQLDPETVDRYHAWRLEDEFLTPVIAGAERERVAAR